MGMFSPHNHDSGFYPVELLNSDCCCMDNGMVVTEMFPPFLRGVLLCR